MRSLCKKSPEDVTAVTVRGSRDFSSGLSFPHAGRSDVFEVEGRARFRAQESSPLAPLLLRWRGEGRRILAMPKWKKTLMARALRRRETYTEKIAWHILRRHGLLNLKFRRQFVFRGFILDFYCHEHKLGVEIDGGIHETQKRYDAFRQWILESHGLKFVRVSAEELERNPEILVTRILQAIASPTKPSLLPPPAKQEGGRGGGPLTSSLLSPPRSRSDNVEGPGSLPRRRPG